MIIAGPFQREEFNSILFFSLLLYSIISISILFCSDSIQTNMHMGGLFIILLLQALTIFLPDLKISLHRAWNVNYTQRDSLFIAKQITPLAQLCMSSECLGFTLE